ncbi:MAG: SDR family oxidoreductase [Microthrixaceae bacterium]
MSQLAGIDGKRIIVTGGGGGLGSVMAAEFARLGAKVLVCGRTEETLRAVVDVVTGESGPDAITSAICDIRDPDAVGAMVDIAVERFGGIDGLVNNASGLFPVHAQDLSPNGFKAVTDIVLQGTFNCSHEVGARWIAAGSSGAIVSVLTPYAWMGGPGIAHTAAAKGGVLNLSRTLGVEWAPHGIRVNCIAPGWMEVGGTQIMVSTPESQRQLLDAIPAGRFLAAEEAARATAFLLSEDASYITGHCLTIDGGHHLSKGLFEFVDELPSRG